MTTHSKFSAADPSLLWPALSRRRFLGVLGAASVAGLGTGGRAWGATGGKATEPSAFLFDWVSAGPRVRVARTYGANAAVITLGSSVLLVDSKTSAVGATLLDEAVEAGGGGASPPIAMAVNTSATGSCTGGNLALNDSGITIIAHTRAKERIATQTNEYLSQVKELSMDLAKPGAHAPDRAIRNAQQVHARWNNFKADDFAPTETVDTETKRDSGKIEFVLHPLAGRTGGDLVVRVPAFNVICAGLLVYSQEHPVVEREPGMTTATWSKALEALAGMCDDATIVVPGLGPPTDKAGVRSQIEYFATLRRAVEDARAAKKTRAEIAKLKPTGVPEWAKSERLARNLVTILDELNAKPA